MPNLDVACCDGSGSLSLSPRPLHKYRATTTTRQKMLPSYTTERNIQTLSTSLDCAVEVQSPQELLLRAGRSRPAEFTSRGKEFGFVYAVVMSQVLTEYFTSGFNVILPKITLALEIPLGKQTWPASAFPLTVSVLLLPFGRLSDKYGGFPVYILLNVYRALQGLGLAASLPSGLMLIGSTYRPGPHKNQIFALYGAAAPLGFFLGILTAALCIRYATWGLYFYIGAGISASTAVVAYFTIPSDTSQRKSMKTSLDIVGCVLLPATMIAIIFAITESTSAPRGWRSVHVVGAFVAGLLLLDSLAKIMDASPLQLVVWFVPMALGGIFISLLGGRVLHLVPGSYIMVVAGVAYVLAPLLLILAPPGASYWHYAFFAMVFATIGIDTTFTVSNVFLTTHVPIQHQGAAGAISGSLVHLGAALFLGSASIMSVRKQPEGELQSFKAVFYLETALAATSLLIMVMFVRVDQAVADLTTDERAEHHKAKQTEKERHPPSDLLRV
ncbi:MFS general substrate transporter [Pseudovirgaria hyperparasitica]|uniref:MFS general substrate transporter n=1 Tax=Pseudovirgaria hyperparasitica TaxID=470096 RepID=A0A6A6VTS7_9PEZI|nr:MFS general substrate transporter [Pseudovirgaria hyperparasitica]KAF2752647.1 MFS general substrate transporter [Pseudovirgaria hyperparasitica]